jgi:SAM-dependent methyltransferase
MAPEYAKRARSLEPVTEAALAPLLAQLNPGSRVLDVGCGAAVPSGLLTANGHEATGIDLSPRMAAVASDRVPNATFLVGDYLEFRFTQRFDAIVAFAFIHLFPTSDALAVLRKLRSDLKPKGLLLIGTTLEEVGREGFETKADYLNSMPRFRKVWTEAELDSALARTGFETIDQLVHIDPYEKRWVDYLVQPR